MRTFFSRNLFLLIPALLLVSCAGREQIEHKYPGRQGYHHIDFAEGFTMQKTDNGTVVTIINPWQGAEDISHKYYLIRENGTIPTGTDPSRIIYVPVEKIICMSMTHLSMIKALNESQTVAAVSGAGFVYDPCLAGRINDGTVSDVGFEAGLNTELILRINPGLVMMYGIGSESAGYTSKIQELGIPVMFNGDYLETHPLGKAEWIKLFGALYCKEETADSIFLSVARSYNETKTLIAGKITKRPHVLLGLPYKDTWFVSPGNSYISRLIRDAGGDYLWEDTSSSLSMPLGIEDVFIRSLTADVWINTGNAASKNEIASLDSRLEIIPCFRNGNLYNNINRITPGGGNDYWETGTLYPDIILKDIAAILHPDLFPEHELVYYKKIE